MQAVFLIAGKGTRLRPLTYHVPKPMIRIAGKNLIEHNFDQLPDCIDECIFVVGHLNEQIINHFGNYFQGKKIKYIKQKKQLGTGHALSLCKDILKDRFLVLMGDDLYCKNDIEKCLKHNQCLLTKEIHGKFAGGRIIFDAEKKLKDIKEGIHKQKTSLVNIGLYIISEKIFDYDLVSIGINNEYGLPQTLLKVAKDHEVKIEKSDFWMQINDIKQLKRVEKILNQNICNIQKK